MGQAPVRLSTLTGTVARAGNPISTPGLNALLAIVEPPAKQLADALLASRAASTPVPALRAPAIGHQCCIHDLRQS